MLSRRRYGLTKPLTPSEQRIVGGVVARVSFEDIGRELGGISKHTVRAHVRAIAAKIIGCEDLEPVTAIIVYARCMEILDTLPQQVRADLSLR